MSSRKKEPMGLYPNLRTHRTTLGWSIAELLRYVERPPSEKTVRRVEDGQPIRLAAVNKLFNAIASENGDRIPDLSRDQEIIVVRE